MQANNAPVSASASACTAIAPFQSRANELAHTLAPACRASRDTTQKGTRLTVKTALPVVIRVVSLSIIQALNDQFV
jgi:hypothetical protein